LVTIRRETPEDENVIDQINREAFGQPDEADIISRLRHRGVLTISLVAVQDGKPVGHIAFSPVIVESEDSEFGGISLGPIAVLPTYQHRGIGSELIQAGLEECRRLGHELVFVLGYPEYYPRFGFVPAKPQGIDCEFKVPDEAWMIMELREGTLDGRRGIATFRPEFHGAT
jgi:putative acetyltransferase